MLGVYDYTVILTYISLMVSIGGMLFSLNGDCRMALVCLAISSLPKYLSNFPYFTGFSAHSLVK